MAEGERQVPPPNYKREMRQQQTARARKTTRRDDLTAIIRGKCISDAATEAAVDALMEYLAVPCGYGCAEPCHPDEHKDEQGHRVVVLRIATELSQWVKPRVNPQNVAEWIVHIAGLEASDAARRLVNLQTAVRERDEARREANGLLSVVAMWQRKAESSGRAIAAARAITARSAEYGSDADLMAADIEDRIDEALGESAGREMSTLRDRISEFATYCRWQADQPGGTKRPGWLHIAGRLDDILTGKAAE